MKRNKYNLSKYVAAGIDLGDLVPVNMVEVLPGDTFQGQTTAILRLAPMVSPVMHPTHIYIHHWFVPWRLVWNEWEDFITGVSAPAVPTITLTGADTIGPDGPYTHPYEYLGLNLPANAGGHKTVNALPLRAYNLIWNEFYRDQQVQSESLLDQQSLRFVCWDKDRFTSMRAAPQLGGAVTINTSGASVTAESVRLSMAVLRLREARNRYGSRYSEYLRYLGVTPSDARLQRPEFLGGGKQTIQFSEVIQTSETGTTPQGNLAGHGIAAVRSNRYRRYFTEHGVVMTMAFVRPVNMYASGADPLFRKTQFQLQYWQKEYENLGMSAVYASELNFYGDNAADNVILGYQDMYDEYRYAQNRAVSSFGASPNATTQPQTGQNWSWTFARGFGGSLGSPLLLGLPPCRPRYDAFAEDSDNSQPVQMLMQHHLIARRLVGRGGQSIIK